MNATAGVTLALLVLSTAIHTAQGAAVPDSNIVRLKVVNDPTVAFRIWFRVGSQDDPAGKEGLALLTASMVGDASTKKNSYEQILQKLYPLAAGYSASAGTEMTIVSGRVHKDNLTEYYPLFVDAMLEPAFAQQDLDRIRGEVLNFLENTLPYASDEELGKAVLYGDIFAGTPYGHIPYGSVASVRAITLEDVRKFYETYYTRDNLVIGIGGGFDDATLERLRADLGKLRGGRPAPASLSVPQVSKGFTLTLVDKDAPATAISMGFPINVLRGTKDWYALAVANSWLGEHRNSSSHLYQVIREARGLNYGDYSYIEHFPMAGARMKPPQNASRRQQIFEIWIRPVPNETRHFALRAALREFKHLVEQGMTEADFELTRDYLRKYVLHYATTTSERLGYALDDRFYRLQGSHLEMFRAMMGTLTLEDVNNAIRKHWRYGQMHIAVVTQDAKKFSDDLTADVPSPITYKTPKPPAVLAEDKEIEKFPVTVLPENVRIVPVKELFQR